ncbi:hypothetical protein [Desulfosporosinus sp. Sb-LF]|uniref:hypothetical protein n=1 Tax=Desulfosporosinus sp. Sb-LF TaxID=2560027 RepID=UPI00107F833A|nr:hypothetical protein [Desulfosporosinus sp. Sb-LF]TGE34527.1 hypothetical protein E4K68_02275 [Desulfosporosinus sp. Sb-LF]
MRSPRSIQDFITRILISDLNMLTVELNRGVVRIDDKDIRLPVIEITFGNIREFDYFSVLNVRLKEFLQDQQFLLTNGDENDIFVFIYQYEMVIK